jgi:hypothetical protein
MKPSVYYCSTILSSGPARTELTPVGTLPTIRGYGASVYDVSTNRLIVYGGTSTYDPEVKVLLSPLCPQYGQ